MERHVSTMTIKGNVVYLGSSYNRLKAIVVGSFDVCPRPRCAFDRLLITSSHCHFCMIEIDTLRQTSESIHISGESLCGIHVLSRLLKCSHPHQSWVNLVECKDVVSSHGRTSHCCSTSTPERQLKRLRQLQEASRAAMLQSKQR